MKTTRWLALAASLMSAAAFAQTIKVGSTLALTGPLAATAATRKLAGEIYVEELNKRGGLLGRKVEWVLKDDQSKPDIARTLYEQLVTVDKVDLLIGPYATANILAAVGVAQRYSKLILHHTAGVPQLIKYDLQFPTGGLPADPEVSLPQLGLNAVALTTFEQHPPFTDNPVAAAFVRIYNERAAKAGLPDNSVELQAAASYATWQTLEAAVNGAKSVDDKALAAWLKKNQVDTIMGRLSWETANNYTPGAALYKVKQLQEGKWTVIWPKQFAAPGAKLIAP